MHARCQVFNFAFSLAVCVITIVYIIYLGPNIQTKLHVKKIKYLLWFFIFKLLRYTFVNTTTN